MFKNSPYIGYIFFAIDDVIVMSVNQSLKKIAILRGAIFAQISPRRAIFAQIWANLRPREAHTFSQNSQILQICVNCAQF